MRFGKLLSTLSLLVISTVNAKSRSDFYGPNDTRPELFRLLDDNIGTIKITLSDQEWADMKQSTVMQPWGGLPKYSTENGKMEFTINGMDKKVEFNEGDFKFSVGGSGSRNFARSGYNIKIKGEDLFGVKLLRLRANTRDISFMREKLCSDILYKMDMVATSANFVNLEVNGEKMGLYVLTNKIKKDFIKRYFGEKDTDNLYICAKDFCRFEENAIVEKCVNTKDELADNKEDLQQFVDAVNNAKSIDDIKDIVDTDAILRSLAFEFLAISWDNFFNYGHNYYWYKRTDGKWMMLINDYDQTFGQDLWPNFLQGEGKFNHIIDKSYIPDVEYLNLGNISIRDIDIGHKIVKLLIYDDNETRWREILADYIKTVFNPETLFPRIDEIADLIREDLAITREVDPATGYSMGSFNTLGYNPVFNMSQFEDSLNYIGWNDNPGQARSYPLRFIIEERFNYVCHTYGIDPKTRELIQPRPVVSFWSVKNKQRLSCSGVFREDPVTSFSFENLVNEDYKNEAYNADPEKNSQPRDYTYPLSIHERQEAEEAQQSTTTIATTTTVAEATETKASEGSCWSEELGYPCCKTCFTYYTDSQGKWGYENNNWCGVPSTCDVEKCWSAKLGYTCCKGCESYATDENGKWGYENEAWCGIIEENCN